MTPLLLLLGVLASTASVRSVTTAPSVLQNSGCQHHEAEDLIDCSGVQDVGEVVSAMGSLSENGLLEFTGFILSGNPRITSLPTDLLGNIRFQKIFVNNNTNLLTADNFLGASRDSVVQIDLSSNALPFIPPLQSSSVEEFTQNAASLTIVSQEALSGMPNLQVLTLQGAGTNGLGVTIGSGAFTSLKKLQVLDMQNCLLHDRAVTVGAFNFNSPSLTTVQLDGIRMETISFGSFEGFTNHTTLTLMLHDRMTIGAFFGVFQSGARIVVRQVMPCYCHLAWIRLSSFLDQASIRCVVRQYYVDLPDVPENYFTDRCCTS